MRSLILDTSSSRIVTSIFNNEEKIYYKEEKNDTNLSTRIFGLIDDAFKISNIKPEDLDSIYVINGPGSFTGIRVGVTIAKTMAWALNKRIVPVSSLEFMATTPFIGDYIVPMIDARRGYVYAGIYDKNLNLYMEESHIKLEELLDKLPIDKNIIFTSFDEFDNIKAIEPKFDIKKILEKYKNDAGKNPHQLNPNYLKLTEAEEKLLEEKC